jgi:hypothetical protein
MDEGKDRVQEAQQITNVQILNLGPEERLRRIQELQAKVIDPSPSQLQRLSPAELAKLSSS